VCKVVSHHLQCKSNLGMMYVPVLYSNRKIEIFVKVANYLHTAIISVEIYNILICMAGHSLSEPHRFGAIFWCFFGASYKKYKV